MNDKFTAYSLQVKFADKVIGKLSLNKEIGLPKLEYNNDWQQRGFWSLLCQYRQYNWLLISEK
ncbi:hypothetical protein [Colwellia sp. PAMC 21821]|uniref:hypothetical protein n=1 Tax=Colwellia sp. PAMC 21821 TaxID=1816219 RepID=UPI0009BC9715|nr:hypothetical protein [Colwellia sp. PAMC 21821]ARD44458.1 hypothetical protein A3Q33_09145 [Colwellia sp. PAMC 21821]